MTYKDKKIDSRLIDNQNGKNKQITTSITG